MNGNTGAVRAPRRGCGPLALLACCLAWAGTALAQQSIGTVTLMAGAPRMVGQTIRPLQAVMSGSVLETGEADAAGVLVQDIVLQIGGNTQVEVLEEADRLLIRLTRGFVVFYTEPDTGHLVVIETPFGRLTAGPGTGVESESGWYSVRHDPEQPAVSPAVSTFAAIEGSAEVEGTAPKAGPHALAAGSQWRIVAGQLPGPHEAGNNRAAAEGLRDMLHRQATELIRSEVSNVDRLAARAGGELFTTRISPTETQAPTGQQIFTNNDAVQNRPPAGPLSVCHGDLVFTNLFVEHGRVTGVYDWSKAALADPAFDVAATRARLGSDVPGLPRPLRLVQRALERRYLASYGRRRTIDPQALHYFDTFWVLHDLAWGLQRSAEGMAPTLDVRDRWLHPEVQAAALDRLSESTELNLAVSASRGR